MKDGIYTVTVRVNGRGVCATGMVRNGVFQGLGELSGIVAVIGHARAAVDENGVCTLPDHGSLGAMSWTRAEISGAVTEVAAVDQKLRNLCAELQRLRAVASDHAATAAESRRIGDRSRQLGEESLALRASFEAAYHAWAMVSRRTRAIKPIR